MAGGIAVRVVNPFGEITVEVESQDFSTVDIRVLRISHVQSRFDDPGAADPGEVGLERENIGRFQIILAATQSNISVTELDSGKDFYRDLIHQRFGESDLCQIEVQPDI